MQNYWYLVLASNQVKKKPVGTVRFGQKLVFWRDGDNKLNCIKDVCAHRGAELSKGKIHGDNIVCPFHGFEYNQNGRCVLIPANGKQTPVPQQFQVNSYPVVEKQGLVWVWYGDQKDNFPEVPYIKELDNGFMTGYAVQHWKTFYTRVIENQLDTVHLPFVHHNTIGFGNRKVVNGPALSFDSENIYFKPYNQKDTGNITAKKSEDLPPVDKDKQHIHFRFPNLFENYLTNKLRILAGFVPVDDENTLLYLIVYQKIIRIPIISHLIVWMMVEMSKIVANQDKRVVETQVPKKTELKMNEKLIPGDIPIITYRKMREEKQNNFNKRV